MGNKPKFNKGDKVYFIAHEAEQTDIYLYVSSGIVTEIKRSYCVILNELVYDTTYYTVDSSDYALAESRVFATKEEVEELLKGNEDV